MVQLSFFVMMAGVGEVNRSCIRFSQLFLRGWNAETSCLGAFLLGPYERNVMMK